MIEVDGSFGEGGGQILRTSLSLSALTQKPVRVFNIRAGRREPGLRPQHLTGLNILAELCGAKTGGASVGSTEIIFEPQRIVSGGERGWDIGTAGSVTLLLQNIFLPAMASGLRFELGGGTDVPFSPPFDYAARVMLPTLGRLGCTAELKLLRRGFYPRGGGRIAGSIHDVEKILPAKIAKRGEIKIIRGISIASGLPEHVAVRQKESAEKILEESLDAEVKIKTEVSASASPGSALVLWAECENSILGADALGERGKRAETVGTEAATRLSAALKTGAGVDSHLADQLIPFMALASGKSEITAAEITGHALTNIAVAEKFLGPRFSVKENTISANGADFFAK